MLFGSFIFLAFGCSSIRIIHTDVVADFSISNYNSYDFYQVELDTADLPDFNKRLDWIKEELQKQFKIKGLEQSDNDPDLLINVGLVLVEKTQTRETNITSDAVGYIGHQNYSWESEEVDVGKYHEATFVLHFVDSENNILVWEGIAQGVVEEKENKYKRNTEIGVKKLFKNVD